MLQAYEIRLPLALNQLPPMLFASIVPAPRNRHRTRGEIFAAKQLEARLENEPLVLSGRQEEVEPNRTTNRELLVRDQTCQERMARPARLRSLNDGTSARHKRLIPP